MSSSTSLKAWRNKPLVSVIDSDHVLQHYPETCIFALITRYLLVHLSYFFFVKEARRRSFGGIKGCVCGHFTTTLVLADMSDKIDFDICMPNLWPLCLFPE